MLDEEIKEQVKKVKIEGSMKIS